jgi:hypothetical protein
VIQRLVAKDQSQRYRTAGDVLRDLPVDPRAAPPLPQEDHAAALAAEAEAAKKKRRLRLAAILALALSGMLCIAMLLPERPKPAPPGSPAARAGVVTNVYPDEMRLAIVSAADGTAQEITLNRHARVFVNDESKLLRDLQPNDRVNIAAIRDEAKREVLEIRATRPELSQGRIRALKADEGQLVMLIEQGKNQGKDLVVAVPGDLRISLNGRDQFAGKPVRLANLQIDDRVSVRHVGEEAGRKATALSAERVVTAEGVVREVDAKKSRLTLALGTGANPVLLTLPFAPQCEVTINDLRIMDQQVLKPANLRPGDKATIAHDTQIVRVNAHRVLGQAGVIRKVHFDARTLDVALEGADKVTTYRVGPACKIALGGEPVELSDLRDGDSVDIAHAPGAANPEALSVAAVRPADHTRWAILIANQNYDDSLLTRVAHPLEDARLLRDALVKRYQVPSDQAMVLTDESLVRLEQGVPDRLRRIGPDGKLIVYLAGHAYQDEDGQVYFAPKDFALKRIGTTGLGLQWLVDQLEECPAKEKLLLLDCTQPGQGADLAQEPAAAEMLRTLKAPPGRAALRTVTAIASCQAGQRGLGIAGKDCSLFAWHLAEGYLGRADKNRDNRLEPTELFGYLAAAIPAAAAEAKGTQTPQLFPPDDRPPRLTEEAKTAIRKLDALLRQDQIDMKAAGQQYTEAAQSAGKEPDARLLYGLLLLKAKQRDEALKHLSELKSERPELLLPSQGIAWVHFDRQAYKTGTEDMQELVLRVPQPVKPTDRYSPEARRIFYWSGQLREFASAAAEKARQPAADSLAAVDAAVSGHGADAQQLYEQGRARTRAIAADFDRQIAAATDAATRLKLGIERRRLVHYADFPFNFAADRILAGLNQ